MTISPYIKRFTRRHRIIILLIAAAILLSLGVYGGYWFAASSQAVPAFARRPYETFNRQETIAIALREWRLFGMEVWDDRSAVEEDNIEQKAERQPGLWQRVGEYRWIGLNYGEEHRAVTGKHDENGEIYSPSRDELYAWSAAFISYVMRIAGAKDGFPYSETHSNYINAARETSLGHAHWLISAQPPKTYAPEAGDLICYTRGKAKNISFAHLPSAETFTSHCDLVVAKEPEMLTVIGGNVHDSVSMKHVPTGDDGRLIGANGKLIDLRYHWFVVLKVAYTN